MTDLRDSIGAIQSLCTDVGRITSTLDEMLAMLHMTVDGLRALNDPHARDAEAEIRVAQAALREARDVWFEDYVHRGEDICRRIAS